MTPHLFSWQYFIMAYHPDCHATLFRTEALTPSTVKSTGSWLSDKSHYESYLLNVRCDGTKAGSLCYNCFAVQISPQPTHLPTGVDPRAISINFPCTDLSLSDSQTLLPRVQDHQLAWSEHLIIWTDATLLPPILGFSYWNLKIMA